MMMLLLLWVPAEIIPVARGAGRHEDTYVKVVISAVAVVVSWTLLLGAPSLALIMIQCRYQQQYTSKAISYGVHVLLLYYINRLRVSLLILDRSWKGWVLTAHCSASVQDTIHPSCPLSCVVFVVEAGVPGV
jgi:hypothetical protein